MPTGQHSISAGLEPNPAAGVDFPRLGSAALNVVAGVDNFVVVRLRPAGRIVGRVLDALGAPVPNPRVCIPEDNGFIYGDGDAQGNYLFDNLGLADYTLSAPGPEVAQTDTTGLIDRIRGGNEDVIQAAIGEAARIFAGVTDPFLNGAPFNPVTWGFTKTHLTFDGQTVVADIRLLRPGTVSGIVLNGQGVPIGAKVRLTGIGPLPNGAPSFIISGEMNSDPGLGLSPSLMVSWLGPLVCRRHRPSSRWSLARAGRPVRPIPIRPITCFSSRLPVRSMARLHRHRFWA